MTEAQTADRPRRLLLMRDEDVTGVSGTGIVAEGVLWTDGTVTLRWLGDNSSLVHWRGVENAMTVHGHDGRTHIAWLD